MSNDTRIPSTSVASETNPRRSARSLGRRLSPLALPIVVAFALLLAGCGSAPQAPTTSRVDRVVVKKSERKLQLMQAGQVLREYRVALGDAPVGHKFREGDERTPIGDYILDWRNPSSSYYRSIHVSYPNDRDQMMARLLGYPSPGGMIMIHGQPNHIRSDRVRAEYARRDWTDGCIAVQDHEMDEIWRLVRNGTPIKILP
jgi:murein L,D-transpeptidase YafK